MKVRNFVDQCSTFYSLLNPVSTIIQRSSLRSLVCFFELPISPLHSHCICVMYFIPPTELYPRVDH